MSNDLTSRHQNLRAIAKAIDYFSAKGHNCFVPLQQISLYQLIVDFDGIPMRIKVVSTSYKTKHGVFSVKLKSCGANNYSQTIRLFSVSDQDYVFVYAIDGSLFLIPSAQINARHHISLNAYTDYQVFIPV